MPLSLMDSRLELIMAHLRDSKYGFSISELSRRTGLNRNTITKYLNVLVTLGQAEIHIVGPSKVFQLSQRLPITKAYLSSLPEPSFIIGEDGRILRVNELFCRCFHVEMEVILGKKQEDLGIPLLVSITNTPEYKNALSGNMMKMNSWVYLRENLKNHRLWIAPVVFHDGTPAVLILIETEDLFF